MASQGGDHFIDAALVELLAPIPGPPLTDLAAVCVDGLGYHRTDGRWHGRCRRSGWRRGSALRRSSQIHGAPSPSTTRRGAVSKPRRWASRRMRCAKDAGALPGAAATLVAANSPRAHREGQEEKLGALGLMLKVIALWNAISIHAVVETLKAYGHAIAPADLARISSLVHRHINFLGRYAFTLPEAVARGELLSLRQPNSNRTLRCLMSVDRSSRTHGPALRRRCSARRRPR